jgi:predicted ATP-binding protein involved in virulence
MKINRLKIKGLFDLFDYDLDFTNEENLKIITGPNGFGKTMILNILYSLFNRQFSFFDKLVFEQIEVFLENDYRVEITNPGELPLFSSNTLEILWTSPVNKALLQGGKAFIISENSNSLIIGIPPNLKTFYDKLNTPEKIKDLQSALSNYLNTDCNIEFQLNSDIGLGSDFDSGATIRSFKNNIEISSLTSLGYGSTFDDDLNFVEINTKLIETDRLKKVKMPYDDNEDDYSVIVNVIVEYAEELKFLIDKKRDEYTKISEKLSADFSKRVLNFKGIISKDIVNSKVERLKEKQKVLKKYDLSEIELDMPNLNEISENDLKLVSVDLDDLEKKLSVFDDLLEKIKLFVDILSERRLSFKHIEIDLEKGFICRNDKGKILSLEELSSGEKHQIVLLYELIFKTTENTLLLIDEPEISLHVAWQKEFIDDLLKIIKLKNIQAIVATHSLQIINRRWDLEIDLVKQKKI